ncbi:GrpB family protein [Lutispora saccharofermentans]|uniref:GrpB family protein n=1 Tax=Lutispora saccharofermentans TaxID=3024236 RepID=A0ABT1NNX2_9FIRM|nr:GrpB family protein [Lutispora saccharofermentans]MCQ1531798.1 GrpB family protein [Lutispora saccharofermentans]
MKKTLSEMTLEELWELFPIILKEHNPEYEKWYLIEKEDIIRHIGQKNIKRINHIGSTSVEGLIAKPTIDILLELDNDCNLEWLKSTLTGMGWLLMSSENESDMRMAFNKGYTPDGFDEKVYHLHVRYHGDWNELYFKDYLREHSEVAEEYGLLKKLLWKKFEHNRDGYTDAKTEFIMKYTNIARACYGDRYSPDATGCKENKQQ